MKKNTAGLVALAVLVIATLLMVFVVLPNVGDKPASPVAEGAPSTTAPASDGAPGTPGALSSGAAVPQQPSDTASADTKSGDPKATGLQTTGPQTTGPQTTASKSTGSESTETQTAQAPSAAPSAADAKGDRPVASGAPTTGPAPAPASSASPAVPDTDQAIATPSFDIVRIEPDGSTVIAGRAAPNSKLEIVNGETVVGTAEAGGTGDFAAIFDKPLAPGDYQLTLRSTAPDGKTTSSQEVATVSVPKTSDGDLLAMVTKPGEASRIITAPGTDGAGSIAPAQSTGDAAAPSAAPAAANQSAAVSTAQQGGSAGSSPAMPASQTPSGQASAPATASPNGVAPGAPVAVSAVEIEGSKLFVAGTARPGSTVRVYADDKLVGEAKVDPQGRFVVDGQIALSVGQHAIRVDMIGADGKVQLRAAVPFDRPEGDQISVVAQTPASRADQAFDSAIFDASRTEAAKAFALLKGLFADGKLPGLDTLAAARSATEIALTSLAGVKPVPDMPAAVSGEVRATIKAAGDALAILKPLPRDAAAVGAALPRLEAAMARVLQAAPPAPLEATTAPGTPAATASKPSETAPQTAASPGEPETVQQAPLLKSTSSVIIRRGDTLWQISRRVYGAGVRYTTIYVANEDQIIDPDRILPGQVFGVPDTAMPDPESQELHRRHMQHTP